MSNTYQIYLISDSTGETLDRIFLALKAQFNNIEYKVHSYSFTRTENQILKILNLFDFPTFENCAISKIIFENVLLFLDNVNDLQSNCICSDSTIQIFSFMGCIFFN